MLAFIIALTLPPVLLSFALADDFRDAVVWATIGMVAVVGLLTAITLTNVAQDAAHPQTALVSSSSH